MKIMSLNVNSFNGDKESLEEFKKTKVRNEYDNNWSYYNDVLSRWDNISKSDQLKQLLEIVQKEFPDVLILQEYDINSTATEKLDFESKMEKKGYKRKSNPVKGERPSYTVVYCLDYDGDGEEKQFSFGGRVYVLKYKGFFIIGAHMPFNPKDGKDKIINWERVKDVEKLWEEITDYLSEKKSDKAMLIGDLNVFDKETHQYKSFSKLFDPDPGMKDLWLKMSHSNDTPTNKKYKNRLDYALLTPGLLESYKCEMRLIPESDEEFLSEKWVLSDHRILVIEIKEDEK